MRLFSIIFPLIFLSSIGSNVLFNSPVSYPWFIEHISFEPVDLPPGVSALFVTDTDESTGSSREFIVFKNISSTPLLVVGRLPDDYTEFESTPFEFPSGTGPLYKVIDGKAYVWRVKYNHPGSGYYYAWFKEAERDDSIWLFVYDNQIWCQNAIIVELEPLNQFGGERPKDVQIPGSQHVTLLIIYGSEQIDIPITVSYTLNAEYRSFESIQNEQTLYNALICFIPLAVLLLIGWWINRRPTKKQLRK